MIRQLIATTTALSVLIAPIAASASEACSTDAMIVFDGSASMAEVVNMGAMPPRIAEARRAVAQAMPYIAPYRRVGLIVYGPSPAGLTLGSCDGLDLRFAPQRDASTRLLAEIDDVTPSGQTALTEAVKMAAEALDFEQKPGMVVLITDGAETCGGSPCYLASDLAARAKDLTIHVIGFRVRHSYYSIIDKGEDGATPAECLPALNGGQYTHTQSVEELAEALTETLGCETISQLGSMRRAG